MKQTHIYDYLGTENDPVFDQVAKLKMGQAVELGGVKVSLNKQDLYEIETGFTHECFKSKGQVYNRLSEYFSL